MLPLTRHVRDAVPVTLPIRKDAGAELLARSLIYQIHYPTPVPPMAAAPLLLGVDKISKAEAR